jgi:hypothetical protein
MKVYSLTLVTFILKSQKENSKMKAQVSMEFFIFSGLALIMAIALSLNSISQIKDFNRQRENDAIKDLALRMQREAFIASYVEDGYYRQFHIPDEVSGYNFSVVTSNKSISVISKNSFYLVNIPFITGNMTNGTNTINRTNGVIYVNQ